MPTSAGESPEKHMSDKHADPRNNASSPSPCGQSDRVSHIAGKVS